MSVDYAEIAEDTDYPASAFHLVHYVVNNMRGNVAWGENAPPAAQKGISPHRLCAGLLSYCHDNYDESIDYLDEVGLGTSEDLAEVMEILVRKKLAKFSKGESKADFADIYELPAVPESLLDCRWKDAKRKSRRRKRAETTPALIARFFQPVEPEALVVTKRSFPFRVRADLQRAVDELESRYQIQRFTGVSGQDAYGQSSFPGLLRDDGHPPRVAPPAYDEVDVGGAVVACLTNGLWLCQHEGTRFAVFMSPEMKYGCAAGVQFEIAVSPGDAGKKLSHDVFEIIARAVSECRNYRGKILSLEAMEGYHGASPTISVHQLRHVRADQVVLPTATRELLTRNVVDFVKQRPELKRLGLGSKKGLLFYGPPGTGKTHTIHYLAGVLPDHTTLLVTAEQVAHLSEYMTLAKLLQPAMVVIEDVDLIARSREQMQGPCEESLLNKLLNEMDGLREEIDVLFVLTTNRPDQLESALAGRPGRIDQAIEFPYPDEENRRKLIDLYRAELVVSSALADWIVARTERVSAAFIRELMRRSAQFQLSEGGNGTLNEATVELALNELLFSGGSLNRKLLGVDQ